jgi:hypothetical protein
MRIKKLLSLFFISWLGITITVKAQPGEPISDISAFCSQQKGFNLLGKFDVSWSNTGFTQKEFSTIKDLEFNFVRLPLDYRTYTQAGNWDNFIEATDYKNRSVHCLGRTIQCACLYQPAPCAGILCKSHHTSGKSAVKSLDRQCSAESIRKTLGIFCQSLQKHSRRKVKF